MNCNYRGSKRCACCFSAFWVTLQVIETESTGMDGTLFTSFAMELCWKQTHYFHFTERHAIRMKLHLNLISISAGN